MLVGIYSSQPQSGKSTVKAVFTEHGFIEESFATPVKESLLVVLRSLRVIEPKRYLWGDWKHKVIPGLGVTGGYLMSTYATDYMRNSINKDVWRNALESRLKFGKSFVVDDLRFPNEYIIFDYTIRVIREDAPGHDRSDTSEGQLDDFSFDYIILNNGTTEDLKQQASLCLWDILRVEQKK
jgi:hypothetical protein